MGMLFSLIGFAIVIGEFIYAIIKKNNEIKATSLKYMIFFYHYDINKFYFI